MDAWKLDRWRLTRGALPNAPGVAGTDGVDFVSVTDATLRVQVLGKGLPTVVLCVDPPNVIEHYRPIVDALTPTARVICFELPGTGYSRPKDGYRFTLDDQVKAVTELLDRLVVKKATFAFPCLTAFVGIAVGNKRPDFVERFVIAQGAGFHEAVKWTHRIDALGLLRVPFVGQLANWAGRKSLVRRFYSGTVSPDDPAPDAQISTAMQALARGAECCLATDFQRLRTIDGRKISGLNLPATIVWGEGDPTHKKTDRTSIRNHLPRAHVVHFWGMGHFPDLDDPLRFAQLLLGIAESAEDGPTTEQEAPSQMSALEAELFSDGPPAGPIPTAEPEMDTRVTVPAEPDMDGDTSVGTPALPPEPMPVVAATSPTTWSPLPPRVQARAPVSAPVPARVEETPAYLTPEPDDISVAPDPRVMARTAISAAPFLGEPDPEEAALEEAALEEAVIAAPVATVSPATVEPPWLASMSVPAPPVVAPKPVPFIAPKPMPVARIEPVPRAPSKTDSLELDVPRSSAPKRSTAAQRPASSRLPSKKRRGTSRLITVPLRLLLSTLFTAAVLFALGASLVAGVNPQDIPAALPALAHDPRVLAFLVAATLTPLFAIFLHAFDFLFPGERGLVAIAGAALAGIVFVAIGAGIATAATFPLTQLADLPGPLADAFGKIDWVACTDGTRAALPGLLPAWQAIATAGIVVGVINAILGPR